MPYLLDHQISVHELHESNVAFCIQTNHLWKLRANAWDILATV